MRDTAQRGISRVIAVYGELFAQYLRVTVQTSGEDRALMAASVHVICAKESCTCAKARVLLVIATRVTPCCVRHRGRWRTHSVGQRDHKEVTT